MPLEPPLAHLLGIPLEELLFCVLGLGTGLTYIRLRLTHGGDGKRVRRG